MFNFKNETGWDYADLTKNASEVGGVDKFIKGIHKDGTIDGIAYAVVFSVICAGVYYGGKQLKKSWDKYIEEKKDEYKKIGENIYGKNC